MSSKRQVIRQRKSLRSFENRRLTVEVTRILTENNKRKTRGRLPQDLRRCFIKLAFCGMYIPGRTYYIECFHFDLYILICINIDFYFTKNYVL